ncbi:MAG: NAD-binding protein [Christensenellales bacterium]
MEAGLQEADLVIAVTGSDELNLLCCTIAKRPAASWRPSRACAIRITARSCRICVSSSDYP